MNSHLLIVKSSDLDDRENFHSLPKNIMGMLLPTSNSPTRVKIIILLIQTMDRLEQMLQDSEIEYTEKIFKTEDGIGGIGDQIFVSLKNSTH